VLTLVDDSYNANPDSMRAALDVLAELPGPRLMVMGDMGEVGDQGPQFHAKPAPRARAGHRKMFTLGEQSQQAAAGFGGAQVSAAWTNSAAVLAELPHTGSVLVKGSRFMKMERVVQAITAHAQDHAQQQQNHKESPMLLSLAQWLQSISPEFGFFRVFQYLTFRAVMAALTALLIGLLAGPFVIRRLISLKIGQPVRGTRCRRT
jgi:hypothetical protein